MYICMLVIQNNIIYMLYWFCFSLANIQNIMCKFLTLPSTVGNYYLEYDSLWYRIDPNLSRTFTFTGIMI